MNSDIEKRLKVIEKATPTLKPSGEGIFSIILVEGNTIDCLVKEGSEGQRSGHVEDLQVLKVLQGHGIGTRLIRSAFRRYAELGVEYVDSGVIHAAVIRICDRVFGAAALHFMHQADAGEIELPISVEQAAASLERVDEIWKAASEEEQNKMDPGIKLRVYLSDLADIDTSSWESPVPLQ